MPSWTVAIPVFFFASACFACIRMFLINRDTSLAGIAPLQVASGEWHRVRRTPAQAGFWNWIAFGCWSLTIISAVLTDRSSSLSQYGNWIILVYEVGVGVAFMIGVALYLLLGGVPILMYDCLANGERLRYRAFKDEREYDRKTTTLEVRRAGFGTSPFVIKVKRDSEERVFAVSERGAATLRALGWIKNEGAP